MSRTPRRVAWWAPVVVTVVAVAAVVAAAPAGAPPPVNVNVVTTPVPDAPPTSPGPIQIAEITENTIRLTWAPSTDDHGVASYQVTQSFTDTVLLRSTTTNEISFSGLQRSRRYGFSVTAIDTAGTRSPSVHLTVIMPPGDEQPPTVPGAPTASNIGATSVRLSWAPSTDNVVLQQYEVVRISQTETTVVATVWLQPPVGPSTSATISGLAAGTAYTFAVRARDEAGNVSAPSPAVTLTTLSGPDTDPPTAPGAPVASAVTASGLTLSWAPATDNVGVARYVVVDLAAEGGPAEVATTSQPTAALGAAPGQSYTFVVYAEDAAGNRSAASGELAVTTPAATGCVVTYRIVAQWTGGFQAEVALRNPSATAIDGWELAWTFPSGQRVSQAWASIAEQSGPDVRFRNQTWNGRIAPGDAIWFGFIGTACGG